MLDHRWSENVLHSAHLGEQRGSRSGSWTRLCSKVCWAQTLRGHFQCGQPGSNQKVGSERNEDPNKYTVRNVRDESGMEHTNGLTQKQSVLIGSRYAIEGAVSLEEEEKRNNNSDLLIWPATPSSYPRWAGQGLIIRQAHSVAND